MRIDNKFIVVFAVKFDVGSFLYACHQHDVCNAVRMVPDNAKTGKVAHHVGGRCAGIAMDPHGTVVFSNILE